MRCKGCFTRLTTINPFKSGSYKDSMYKNYKCKVDYQLLSCMPETVDFIKSLVAKDPKDRFTVGTALNSDIFMKIELDEHYFSNQNLLYVLDQIKDS